MSCQMKTNEANGAEVFREKRKQSLKEVYCQVLTLCGLSICCLAIGIASIYYGVETGRPFFVPLAVAFLGFVSIVIGIVFRQKAEKDNEGDAPSSDTKLWFGVYYGCCLATCIGSFNMLNPLIQIWQRCGSTNCDKYDTELLVVHVLGIVFCVLVGFTSMTGACMFYRYYRAYGIQQRCACCGVREC